MESDGVGSANGGVRGDRFGFDLNDVAGEDEGDFGPEAVLEPSLVPEGEVAGSAEREEGGWYAVGVWLIVDGCEDDIRERLRDIVFTDVLGHKRFGLLLL